MNTTLANRWRRKTTARARLLRRRLRTARPSRSGLGFAAVGLAVVLATPVLILERSTAPPPEQVVADYLDAVRDGDVDRALDLSAWRPRGESATFLTAEALDDDWSFAAVTETGRTEQRATVTARLTASGADDHVTARFDLLPTATGWSLRDPFTSLRFGTRSLGFAEANGVTVESGAAANSATYLFFPGRYEFYTDTAGQLDIEPVETILAPHALDSRQSRPERISGAGVLDLGEPVPSKPGLAQATEAVDDYIDTCADSNDLEPYACPFGTVADLEGSLGYEFMEFEDISWTVTKHPKIEVDPIENGFAAVATKPGEVVFAATGVEEVYNNDTGDFEPVAEHEIAVTCDIDLTSTMLVLNPEREWRAVHGLDENRATGPGTFRPAADVETCMR